MRRNKRLTRGLLRHPALQELLTRLLAWYIRLVFLTSKKTCDIATGAEPYVQGKESAVFAFWHGRMMMMPMLRPPGRRMHILISLHRDGRLISRTIRHLHVDTIQGSTSRRSFGAVMDILRVLKAGDNVGITPDGPRGPSQVAAPGTATIARMAGRPVIPATFSCTRCIRFKSWDRFMLALPFGHIAFFIGSPIVLSDGHDAAFRERIEQAMNRLVEKADIACGLTTKT